jgi:4-hydroxyphenylpyruvate dioxygenase-like putative hemolysin
LIAAEMHKRAVAFHDHRPDVVGQIALAADDDRPAIAKRRVHGERALQFQHHKKDAAGSAFRAVTEQAIMVTSAHNNAAAMPVSAAKNAERRRWATAAPLG